MADMELARVRGQFVDKASKELIKQLLDDILEDGVLNDGEKDSIFEENNSRADKARSRIDTVKKKGDAASRKMIAHFQHRDPTLYSELGLSCGQPAPPAAEPPMEQEWSTTLIPTTDAFWKKKLNNKNIYPVTKDCRGTTQVMLRFEDLSCHNKMQMPTKERCTLTKRFYFFPGH